MKKIVVLACVAALSLIAGIALSTRSRMSEKPTVMIMLGAPGAGKGTQAGRLSEKYDLPQISTGDLFRENLRNETPIGLKVKDSLGTGKLISDDLVLEMLFDRLARPDCENGYILDGCPRTLAQAEAIQEKLGDSVHLVALSIEVPDAVIVERLAGRLICEACGTPFHKKAAPPRVEGECDKCGSALVQRKDDKEEVIRKRLKIYHEQSEPLKGYYAKRKCLHVVDGNATKEETIAKVDETLQGVL